MRRQSLINAGLLTLWLLAIAGGLVVLARYDNTPGSAPGAPPVWPVEAAVQPAKDKATLLVFAHPQCPCTRATISELAQVMTRGDGKLVANVLFLSPKGMPDKWIKSDLWTS